MSKSAAAEREPIVLLVDDDPNDEELARIAFEMSHVPHRLFVTRDGVEALEWIQRHTCADEEDCPRLILLDLKLPKVSGLEVLERVRSDEKLKGVPVVVFTSSSEHKDLARSYELGANAYVRKPIDFSEYKTTVEDVGRFWINRNCPAPWASGQAK